MLLGQGTTTQMWVSQTNSRRPIQLYHSTHPDCNKNFHVRAPCWENQPKVRSLWAKLKDQSSLKNKNEAFRPINWVSTMMRSLATIAAIWTSLKNTRVCFPIRASSVSYTKITTTETSLTSWFLNFERTSRTSLKETLVIDQGLDSTWTSTKAHASTKKSRNVTIWALWLGDSNRNQINRHY